MGLLRKQQIVEEAFQIILNEGIGRLTIKNIARGMGFVESAIYKHFPSKIAILRDIISFVDTECEKIISTVSCMDGDEEAKLYCYVYEWSAVYEKKPYIFPILFSKELFKFSTDITDKLKLILDRQYNFLNEIIESGQKSNIFTNKIKVDNLRLIITSPWVLLIDSWFYRKRSFPLHAASKQLIDDIMKLARSKTV